MGHQYDPYLTFCLSQIGCEQYISVFNDNEIDFECFKSLNEDELAILLVGKLGPQKKILKEIQRIRLIDDEISIAGNVVQQAQSIKAELPNSQIEQIVTVDGEGTQGIITDTDIGRNIKIGEQLSNSSGQPEDEKTKQELNNGTTGVIGSEPKVVDPGIMEKYGFVLPVIGAFATTFAVGTVKKMICDQIVHPKSFMKGSDAVSGDSQTFKKVQSDGNPNILEGTVNESVRSEFLAKYGNPNDPTHSAGHNEADFNNQNSDFSTNDAPLPDFNNLGNGSHTGTIDTNFSDGFPTEAGVFDLSSLGDVGFG